MMTGLFLLAKNAVAVFEAVELRWPSTLHHSPRANDLIIWFRLA